MLHLRHRLGPLRVFDAVCKAGGVRSAATLLNVTPGAVSQQIHQLEGALGVTLFRKSGREIELTEMGRDLAHRIGDLLDKLEATVAEFVHLGKPAHIRLKVIPSFATKWLLPHLADFCTKYPEIDVSMATVNRAEDVQDLGDADFVVRPGNAHWKGLHADLLFEDAFVPACSPSMAKRIKSLTNIGEATHVHSMMRPEAWSLWLTSVGLPPAAAAVRHISLANTALCIQAAADSVGVAMVQLAYIVEDLSNKRVVIPIQHIARTGSGYFLACDASRMNEYPLLQFREWAKRIAVAQNQRTNSALEMFCH
jgi:DNA-binding transcriptional LysR family regulator